MLNLSTFITENPLFMSVVFFTFYAGAMRTNISLGSLLFTLKSYLETDTSSTLIVESYLPRRLVFSTYAAGAVRTDMPFGSLL